MPERLSTHMYNHFLGLKRTKKRPHSSVLTLHLYTVGCHSSYAMHHPLLRCMMSIIDDLNEEIMEAFMDHFSRFLFTIQERLRWMLKKILTTEKELLMVVYAFVKFHLYFVFIKLVVYTNHSTLRCLLNK